MSSIQYNVAPQGIKGDSISQLPVDQSQPTHGELQIVNSLFTKHKSTVSILMEEAKDSIIVGFLFIILSLTPVDGLIRRLIPATDKSPYIRIGLKALIIAALFWLIKHFYLSRSKN